jgi:hypothetical protein
MKVLITVLMVVLILMGTFKLWEYWIDIQDGRAQQAELEAKANIDPSRLAGLPYQLESGLRSARSSGPEAMGRFLEYARRIPEVKDPRLAWIELDYITMISRSDPLEAKKLFWAIRTRTPTNSPIIPRIRVMEKTYGD